MFRNLDVWEYNYICFVDGKNCFLERKNIYLLKNLIAYWGKVALKTKKKQQHLRLGDSPQ